MGEHKSIEDLLDDLVDAYEDYKDQYLRADWVHWSEENESKATDRYFELRQKIINLCAHKNVK